MPRLHIIANALFLSAALGIAGGLRGHRESQRARFTAALPRVFSAGALTTRQVVPVG